MTDIIIVHYDGACSPINPGGHGGTGISLTQNNKILYQESYYIGYGEHISCNVAEYMAVIRALSYLLSNNLNTHEIQCYGDSILTVKQLSGQWKCRNGLYKSYFLDALNISKYFSNITFNWIPREQNMVADELSKVAVIDKYTSTYSPSGMPTSVDRGDLNKGKRYEGPEHSAYRETDCREGHVERCGLGLGGELYIAPTCDEQMNDDPLLGLICQKKKDMRSKTSRKDARDGTRKNATPSKKVSSTLYLPVYP
jgi:ribonuclease HI